MKLLNSTHISAFGGLNFVLEDFDRRKIGDFLNSELPTLGSPSQYNWRDVFYSFWPVFFPLGRNCIAIVFRSSICNVVVKVLELLKNDANGFQSMGSRYKVRDNSGLYFITFTVIGWVDLFVRNDYRDCLLESFRYCTSHKGLRVHAFVIMTSHVHAIVSSEEGADLMGIIRDYKKFTSKRLIELIETIPESRREWLLNKFSFEAQRVKRGKDYIVWQEGYHAKQIETNSFLDEKLNYIHQNPVEAGFVSRPEDYVYGSARNYAGEQGVFEVILL